MPDEPTFTVDGDPPLLHIDDADPGIARRLCALLAKSMDGSGASESEMESAMMAAQRLATTHRIDLATVNRQGVGVLAEEPMLADRIVMDGERRPTADRWLTSILLDHFHVSIVYGDMVKRDEEGRMIWKEGKAGSVQMQCYVEFVGRTSDVQFAIYAYHYLHRAFHKAWRKAKREHSFRMSERAEFFFGVWRGLDKKLKEAREEVETALLKDAGVQESYALALVSEEDKRAAYQHQLHGKLGTATYRPITRTNPEAVSRGMEAGEKIEISLALNDRKEPKTLKGGVA